MWCNLEFLVTKYVKNRFLNKFFVGVNQFFYPTDLTMSNLYPDLFASVEDKTCHSILRSQNEALTSGASAPLYGDLGLNSPVASSNSLYPVLTNFMGVEFTSSEIAELTAYSTPVGNNQICAPLSSQAAVYQKTQVTNALRELTLCKDKDGKVGVRVKAIDNGVFVCLVTKDSPAAMAGLKFGEQILQINGVDMAGKTMDQVHNILKKSPINGISVLVRDRPFERSITLHKDSTGHVGFQFKNGKIISIVQGSSAAKNGLLINHQIAEVNGTCVIGMKDKDITKVFDESGNVIVLTIVPECIYKVMIEKMSSSLFRIMDHTSPVF